jgi:uncharacterized protein (DUF2141 family)
MSALAALLLAAQAGDASAQSAKVSLTVSTVGFRNTTGQAIVAVFDAKDGWPKLDRALRLEKVKLAAPKVDVTFRDLAPGIYAVEVIHDENENGKLDMRWLPYPKPIEGAAASNDAPATLGPPSWSDARFKMSDKGAAITVHMRYW